MAGLQPEADGNCVVDSAHDLAVEVTDLVAEAALVDCSYLLEKDHGVLRKAEFVGSHVDMGRQSRLAEAARDRGGDDSRAVSVADVVLNYKYRSLPALFASDDGAQICKINISSFNIHVVSPIYFLFFIIIDAADVF